jgi:hypothetical protein
LCHQDRTVLVVEDDPRLPGTIALRWKMLLADKQWRERPVWGNPADARSLAARQLALTMTFRRVRVEDRRRKDSV